jgi:hypothetical protein
VQKVTLYFALSATIVLSGCGTYVPEIQDFGDSTKGDVSRAGQLLVSRIVESVRCEVRNAVYELYHQEGQTASGNGLKQIAFLDNWAAQILLNLTVDEQGNISPSSNIIPLSQPKNWIFNLGLGVSGSSEAQRINKVSFIYSISDLKKYRCQTRPDGFFLEASDLKFKEWLYDAVDLEGQELISLPTDSSGPLKQNVLYYEVKFDVITSGAVSPGWKLVNATINQNGTFFTARRDRTHDLQITLGPAATAPVNSKDPKSPKILQLSAAAANTALAGDIGASVASALSQQITVNPLFPLF